jgi:hypothetical protein
MIVKNTTTFVCYLLISSFAFTQPLVSVKDFQIVLGSWQGSLTYLDYTTNKPFTMPANIAIKQMGSNTFLFMNSFPDEPNVKWTDTLIISSDGKMINEEKVTSKKTLPNGTIEIITDVLGIDGNEKKPARIKHIYTIGKNILIKRKEVLFTGSTEWIQRNEYRYVNKKLN